MVSQFRCNAKHFSLTYPKCTASKELLLEYLKNFLPIYCCVAEEKHQDGTPHLHAAIGFKARKNIKNMNHFDFQEFHCNIQATKCAKDWIAYIQKDNNYITFGTIDSSMQLSSIPEEELFNHCVNKKIGYGYYQEEKRRRQQINIDITQESPGTMNFYLSTLLYDFSKTTLLIGTSGAGKTTWAIKHAPKPAIIITHIDDLRRFKPNHHKSIIFDDMSFTQWPITSQISIVDRDLPRSIHIRYGVITIPAFTIKIFTCNTMPFDITVPTKTSEDPILRRIKLIEVYDKTNFPLPLHSRGKSAVTPNIY